LLSAPGLYRVLFFKAFIQYFGSWDPVIRLC
jgi:hypothetical protein